MTVPLGRLEIAGFRSILDRTSLDLGALNVLIGPNSAGKSSVLQSLLLVSQSLSADRADRPLVLNGPIVQLGRPHDCMHEEAKHLELGFFVSIPENGWMRRRPTVSSVRPSRRESVKATIRLRAGKSGFETSHAEFEVCADEQSAFDDLPPRSFRLIFDRRTKEDAIAYFRDMGFATSQVRDAVRAGVQPISIGAESDSPIIGANFSRLLPGPFFESEDEVEAQVRSIITAVRRSARFNVSPDRQTTSRRVPPDVLEVLEVFARDMIDGFEEFAPTTGRFSEVVQELTHHDVQRLRPDVLADWYDLKREALPSRTVLSRHVARTPLDDALWDVRVFFADNVRHVGPLREAPRPLYAMAQAGRNDWVGASGEFTAALLSARRDTTVMCPHPVEDRVMPMKLGSAVDLWLHHLGLSESVRSVEQGMLGYAVDIKMGGVKKRLNLTAVGVGVSQALPVVVQGLVSPAQSLLLFEQPELHLHPDTQAALADFVLRLAQSGRQLLVETHSEYFLTRLRRRAAEDPGADTAELVRLFFVEREGSSTTVRTVEMNSFGSIPRWPVGFLDIAARETEAIMRAMEAKRERQHPDAD